MCGSVLAESAKKKFFFWYRVSKQQLPLSMQSKYCQSSNLIALLHLKKKNSVAVCRVEDIWEPDMEGLDR